MDAARRLATATWTEVDAAPPRVVLVPVGSCEQHGPHLPLDTDTRIATAVAEHVAAGRDDAVVAPSVAYGSSGEHQGFAGTISIGAAALTTVLVELGRSLFPEPATAADRLLVFVNGHGGNAWPVHRAVEVLRSESRPVRAWSPSVPDGDAHAGRTETSLMLAIAPHLVRADRPVGSAQPVAELLDRMRADGVRAVAPNGVLGDAREAGAEEGHRLLAALVEDLDHRLGSE